MAVKSLNQLKNRESKANYLLKLFLRSLMIAAVIFFVFIFIFSTVLCNNNFNKEKPFNKYLYGTFVIISESMIPTINVQDAVIVKKVENDNLKIGDIITFNSNDILNKGMTVTHRITGIQKMPTGGNIYRTKGDNNTLEDTAVVDLNSIYGKVILIIPKIGYISKFLTSIPGFITVIVIPIVFVVFYEFYRIRKLLKLQEQELNNL